MYSKKKKTVEGLASEFDFIQHTWGVRTVDLNIYNVLQPPSFPFLREGFYLFLLKIFSSDKR